MSHVHPNSAVSIQGLQRKITLDFIIKNKLLVLEILNDDKEKKIKFKKSNS